MSLLKRVLWWVRARLDVERVKWNVEEDIRTHIEQDAERLRSGGMEASAAWREAQRRFGDRPRVRNEMLRVASVPSGRRSGLSVGRAWTNLRHGTRGLRATPVASGMVIATLAAAVGVTTFMVTLGRAVLLGAGGVDNPARVVSVFAFYPTLPDGMREQPIHATEVPLIRDVEGIDAVAAFKAGYFNLTGRGAPRRLSGLVATPRLFDVAGVHPLFGPGFDDAVTGEEKVVVLSWELWTDAFGADLATIGSSLTLNNEPYVVVGVMPSGFAFPRGSDVPPTFRFPSRPDVWVPYLPPSTGPSDLAIVARLRPNLATSSLEPALGAVVDELARTRGRRMEFSYRAVELREQAVGRIRPALIVLLIATGLVMAVAIANDAGVSVARSEGRLPQLAVRSALGAGRRGVASYLAAESFALGVAASVGGIAVAYGLGVAVRATAPEGIPGIEVVRMTPFAASVAVALALASGACLALGPLFHMRRWSLGDALRGARSAGGPGARRSGYAVVALELAATLILLSGSFVLTRTARNLLSLDPGFDPAGVLTAEVTLPESAYPDTLRATKVQRAEPSVAAAVPRFQRELVRRLEDHADIEAAGFANPLPFSGGQEATVYWVDGADETIDPPFAEYTVVTEGYFRALGIPLLDGRAFGPEEAFDSEPVAIVSASLAAQFPRGEAIGRRVKLGGSPQARYPWLRVVGVVGDVKRTDLVGPGRPELYVHISQGGYTSQATSRLVVRPASGRTPRSTIARVRSVLGELDSDLPLNRVSTMTELVASSVARARFTAGLAVGFAALALLITALGLYSVISFATNARSRELAVRSALGATGFGVVLAVLGETIRAVAIGIALGLGGMVLAARALRSIVFGVAPLSPSALLASLAVLSVIAALAALGPVRGCLRESPARVLSRD